MGRVVGLAMTEDILIIASTLDRARDYAERYGYHDAKCITINKHTLRGYCPKRLIVVDPLDEYQQIVIGPIKAGGTEILYA